mmetsp:Transcript_4972/g.15842  ORF Transcript_4972/g.15842 Transcript_4972/m.15842 type:complete len:693 (-) Transcript_4972:301-2379(-)
MRAAAGGGGPRALPRSLGDSAAPERRRVTLLIAAILSISLTGGTVYGWPAMRIMLLRENVLHDSHCSPHNSSSASTAPNTTTRDTFTDQCGRLPAHQQRALGCKHADTTPHGRARRRSGTDGGCGCELRSNGECDCSQRTSRGETGNEPRAANCEEGASCARLRKSAPPDALQQGEPQHTERTAYDSGECDARELLFGAVYVVGSWANQFGRLPAGLLLDRIGPRLTSTTSALVLAIGALIFGLASSSVGGLLIGFLLLGLGGAGLQISVQSTAALFPRHRSFAMSCMSGAYQLATGIFVVFEAIHDPGVLGDLPRLSLRWLMFIYVIISLALAVLSFMTWPRRPFSAPAAGSSCKASTGTAIDSRRGITPLGQHNSPGTPNEVSTNDEWPTRHEYEGDASASALTVTLSALQLQGLSTSLGSETNVQAGSERNACAGSEMDAQANHSASDILPMPLARPAAAAASSENGTQALPMQPFRAQLFSVEFYLVLFWFALNMLQCQFTVGSIGIQLELKGDDTHSATSFFGTALSLAFIVAPLVGAAIDFFGFSIVMTVVTVELILTDALLLFPSLSIAYPMSIIYAAGRVSLWATFFSYCGAVFGFVHYGKIVGLLMMLASSFSLLQYPLLDLAISKNDASLSNSSSDFTMPNALFIGLQTATLLAIPRLGAAEGARLELDGPNKEVGRHMSRI